MLRELTIDKLPVRLDVESLITIAERLANLGVGGTAAPGHEKVSYRLTPLEGEPRGVVERLTDNLAPMLWIGGELALDESRDAILIEKQVIEGEVRTICGDGQLSRYKHEPRLPRSVAAW